MLNENGVAVQVAVDDGRVASGVEVVQGREDLNAPPLPRLEGNSFFLLTLGSFEEALQGLRAHVLGDEYQPRFLLPFPTHVGPILVELDNVGVVYGRESLEDGPHVVLLSPELLDRAESGLVPNHFTPLLRVHGQIGGVNPGDVAIAHNFASPLVPGRQTTNVKIQAAFHRLPFEDVPILLVVLITFE